ncbi:MAG: hypothetical protein BRD48_06710 [Bacteroidetes bacterium QS_9_68_14]|nr:MAG: hypothetical protein BRD48_06710 [Bacteroidetes bacterium QS_9_68_14]
MSLVPIAAALLTELCVALIGLLCLEKQTAACPRRKRNLSNRFFSLLTENRPLKTDPRRPTTDSRYGWLLATAVAAVLVAGAFLPPLVDGAARVLARQAFAPVCHQLPARSFALAGVPLAVGHRCLGIYVGLLAGTVAWPLLPTWLRGRVGPRAGALVLAAGAPAAGDWALSVAGLWANTALTRTVTGALLGGAMGLLFARAMAQMASRRVARNAASERPEVSRAS